MSDHTAPLTEFKVPGFGEATMFTASPLGRKGRVYRLEILLKLNQPDHVGRIRSVVAGNPGVDEATTTPRGGADMLNVHISMRGVDPDQREARATEKGQEIMTALKQFAEDVPHLVRTEADTDVTSPAPRRAAAQPARSPRHSPRRQSVGQLRPQWSTR